MSVDTYLKGKNLTKYRTILHQGMKLFIAPVLHSQTQNLKLDVSEFLIWRSIRAEVEPIGDHFHSPACRH